MEPYFLLFGFFLISILKSTRVSSIHFTLQEKNKASKMPAETTEDGIERGRQGRKETDDDIVGRNSDFKKHVPVAESLPTKYNSKTKKQYGSAVCILL